MPDKWTCPECGFSQSEAPANDRCPECGAAPTETAAAEEATDTAGSQTQTVSIDRDKLLKQSQGPPAGEPKTERKRTIPVSSRRKETETDVQKGDSGDAGAEAPSAQPVEQREQTGGAAGALARERDKIILETRQQAEKEARFVLEAARLKAEKEAGRILERASDRLAELTEEHEQRTTPVRAANHSIGAIIAFVGNVVLTIYLGWLALQLHEAQQLTNFRLLLPAFGGQILLALWMLRQFLNQRQNQSL